jgi:hypothetical protein
MTLIETPNNNKAALYYTKRSSLQPFNEDKFMAQAFFDTEKIKNEKNFLRYTGINS